MHVSSNSQAHAKELRDRPRRGIWCATATLSFCGLALGNQVGCSFLIDAKAYQCATNEDCAGLGAAFQGSTCGANSVCIVKAMSAELDAGLSIRDSSARDAGDAKFDRFVCPTEVPPGTDLSAPVSLRLSLEDFDAPVVPNGEVRLCAASDVQCQAPLDGLVSKGFADAGTDASAGTDAGKGWVPISGGEVSSAKIDRGFSGFFEARAPGRPNFHYVIGPLLAPLSNFFEVMPSTFLPNAVTERVVGRTGSYEESAHGLVLISGYDCQGRLVGATFTTTASDPLMVAFYDDDADIERRTGTQTAKNGRGGFVNVPVGLHTFTMWYEDANSKREVSSIRAYVRAGAVTHFHLKPPG
jgi:hypothetical protein